MGEMRQTDTDLEIFVSHSSSVANKLYPLYLSSLDPYFCTCQNVVDNPGYVINVPRFSYVVT